MLRKSYIIHTPEEIARIRVAAAAAAQAREKIASMAEPGMTTRELDMLAGAVIRDLGGTPTFLGYGGFPANICISLNDEVIHGIASDNRVIQKGDVLSIDVGVTLNGAIGDTAKTIVVGEETASADIKRLIDGTRLSLEAGIQAAKCGNCIQDISKAVEKVGLAHKLGIVREYVGHGCGIRLHEPPEVPNFSTRSRGEKLLPGMVLCIEPMMNLGTHRVFVERDNWTVRTADGKKSAHFEHMVLITEGQTEVLTKW